MPGRSPTRRPRPRPRPATEAGRSASRTRAGTTTPTRKTVKAAPAPRRPTTDAASRRRRSTASRRRLLVLWLALTMAFALVTVRLVSLQVSDQGHYRALGLNQRVRTVTLAAERGAIFDRNGNDLAVSLPAQTVYADPRVIDDPVAYARALAPIVGINESELASTLAQSDLAFVYVARRVDDAIAERVKELDLSGIGFIEESKRRYPSGDLAAPILGFVGTDNEGLGGLETAFDGELTGTPGEVAVERDPQGREIPNGERSVRPARRGSDLVLTIDQSLQFQTESVLAEQVIAAGAHGGTAIVMDVRTGDILAMAGVEGALDGEPAHPSSPQDHARATADVYEPGSTMKAITVAAAIEEGLVSPDTRFSVPFSMDLGGYTFEDHDPHGTESWPVSEILSQSSNIGTIMIGQELGRERFDHYARAFGFGSGTGLGFPGESDGIMLPLDDYNESSMGSIPIGNGISVTALQMLNVYATLANGGIARTPRIVAATVDADGSRHERPAAEPRVVVSGDTAAAMVQMLEGVVTDGTGNKAAIPGYHVAGKTGTARKPPYDHPPYQYVASFAGFAPANSPRLAAIVVLDQPSTAIYGGEVAAPAFARIMQFALRLERVPPSMAVSGTLSRPVTSNTSTTSSTRPAASSGNRSTAAGTLAHSSSG